MGIEQGLLHTNFHDYQPMRLALQTNRPNAERSKLRYGIALLGQLRAHKTMKYYQNILMILEKNDSTIEIKVL